MRSTAIELEQLVETNFPELRELNDIEASLMPHPGKWSKKQIIGHLVDSAQNNLRRFVVAQYEDKPTIVYQQDFWVSSINYQQWALADLIQLWFLCNKQIVQVLHTISDEAAERLCETQATHSLRWLADDYIKHLQHHLHQVLDREEIPYP
jgi:hypothetical protein